MTGKTTSADPGQTSAVPGRNGEPENPADLAAELARQRQEVLRLRDLLIARDAELGAAKGRLAELEARSMQLLGAAARLRRLLPGFVWRALAGLRRSLR